MNRGLLRSNLHVIMISINRPYRKTCTSRIARQPRRKSHLRRILALVTVRSRSSLYLRLPHPNIRIRRSSVRTRIRHYLLYKRANARQIIRRRRRRHLVTAWNIVLVSVDLCLLHLNRDNHRITGIARVRRYLREGSALHCLCILSPL